MIAAVVAAGRHRMHTINALSGSQTLQDAVTYGEDCLFHQLNSSSP